MTVVEIVALVVAFGAAGSRLLDASKPFWNLMPSAVAACLPSAVFVLPQVVGAFGGVTTTLGLVQALVVSLALLLPGAAAAVATKKEQAK